jgi:hypothetical protein
MWPNAAQRMNSFTAQNGTGYSLCDPGIDTSI